MVNSGARRGSVVNEALGHKPLLHNGEKLVRVTKECEGVR
jgi:hypothetical protein